MRFDLLEVVELQEDVVADDVDDLVGLLEVVVLKNDEKNDEREAKRFFPLLL